MIHRWTATNLVENRSSRVTNLGRILQRIAKYLWANVFRDPVDVEFLFETSAFCVGLSDHWANLMKRRLTIAWFTQESHDECLKESWNSSNKLSRMRCQPGNKCWSSTPKRSFVMAYWSGRVIWWTDGFYHCTDRLKNYTHSHTHKRNWNSVRTVEHRSHCSARRSRSPFSESVAVWAHWTKLRNLEERGRLTIVIESRPSLSLSVSLSICLWSLFER